MDDLSKALLPVIQDIISKEVEGLNIEDRMTALIEDVAKKATKVLEIKIDGKDKSTKLNLVHKQFEWLLNTVKIQGINTLLTGGAGLSKTTAVEQVALALQLEFGSISFSNQTTKTDLMGFVDANGIYRPSSFVDSFEHGKLFLADEMDACSSNVLVLLNSAISNGFLQLPNNKKILVHDNFRFVATANTNLKGGSNGFTARNVLDSATIDRFCTIVWELDLELEEKITSNDKWLEIVRTARKFAENNFEDVVITPRASYDGAKLLKNGLTVLQVAEMTLLRGIGEDERASILAEVMTLLNDYSTEDIPKDEEDYESDYEEDTEPQEETKDGQW